MTGTEIDAYARGLLKDPDAVHWLAADMLRWIGAAQRAVVVARPKANTVTKLLTLTAGVAQQSVAATTLQVLDVMSNMGTDGTTPGREITFVSRDRLAAVKPGWRRETGPYIRHWMDDERDGTIFYVWPAPQQAIKVEARTCDLPAEITALTDTVALGSEYKDAVVQYVLSLAHSQDGESTLHMAQAQAHFSNFAQIMGIKVPTQKKASAPANSTENAAYPAVDKNGA